nr:LysR family transcriptional regulator [uncultured Brevundimonas sp.]
MRRRLRKLTDPDEPSLLLRGRVPLASLIQALAVAEHLSFYRAANTLGVSQSSVSARIKALEEDLGILLFERNTRGVRLTEAGRLFVERVSAGVEHLDHAVKSAGMAALGECGRLRIGVHGLIPHSFLANLIGRYRDDYPGIDLEIAESTAREAITQLRAGHLDIAFVVGTPDLPDCRSRRVWTEPLVVALSDRHPLVGQEHVTWADLAGETFLVRPGGPGPQVHDHILLRLAGQWPAPTILRIGVERASLVSMVGQGFGVTLLGSASSLSPVADVRFLPIADEPEPVMFSAVWLPFNQSAALRNLLDLADEMRRKHATVAAPA